MISNFNLTIQNLSFYGWHNTQLLLRSVVSDILSLMTRWQPLDCAIQLYDFEYEYKTNPNLCVLDPIGIVVAHNKPYTYNIV